MSQQELLTKCFKKLLTGETEVAKTYLKTKTEWDFSIHLSCSEIIKSYNSTSHQLKTKIISANELEFEMNESK